MQGKRHVFITGANSGLGFAASMALAQRGWYIHMACRNEEKGKVAAASVNKRFGPGSAAFVHCDLVSFSSIRRAVESFSQGDIKLVAVVNNAGIITYHRQTTDHGLELQLGVNHLGHFLLTHLLLPQMDWEGAHRPRVLTVTSGAHKIGQIHWNDLQLEEKYSAFRSYAQSKLANILFTYELAQRLRDKAFINCIHPGAVASNFGKNAGGVVREFFFTAFGRFFLSPDQAAEAVTALIDESQGEVTGKYFNKKVSKPSSKRSYDKEAALRLWEESEKMVQLGDGERIDERMKSLAD